MPPDLYLGPFCFLMKFWYKMQVMEMKTSLGITLINSHMHKTLLVEANYLQQTSQPTLPPCWGTADWDPVIFGPFVLAAYVWIDILDYIKIECVSWFHPLHWWDRRLRRMRLIRKISNSTRNLSLFSDLSKFHIGHCEEKISLPQLIYKLLKV